MSFTKPNVQGSFGRSTVVESSDGSASIAGLCSEGAEREKERAIEKGRNDVDRMEAGENLANIGMKIDSKMVSNEALCS